MLISASKVIHLPIIEAVGLKRLGSVCDIIVDPDAGTILGFTVHMNRFLLNKKVLSEKDVREIFANGVLVNSSEDIINSKEIYRINEVLKKGIIFLKSKVYSQNNNFIGSLDDFIFDKDTNKVISIFVKKPFYGETRIINANRILSVLPGKIIVRDLLPNKALGGNKVHSLANA